jgi:hypothetical protein
MQPSAPLRYGVAIGAAVLALALTLLIRLRGVGFVSLMIVPLTARPPPRGADLCLVAAGAHVRAG